MRSPHHAREVGLVILKPPLSARITIRRVKDNPPYLDPVLYDLHESAGSFSSKAAMISDPTESASNLPRLVNRTRGPTRSARPSLARRLRRASTAVHGA